MENSISIYGMLATKQTPISVSFVTRESGGVVLGPGGSWAQVVE